MMIKQLGKYLNFEAALIENLAALELDGIDALIIIACRNLISEGSPLPSASQLSSYLGLLEADCDARFASLLDRRVLALEAIDGNYQCIIAVENRLYQILLASPAAAASDEVYQLFEHELGRTLNSAELALIQDWANQQVDLDLIKEALRIAVVEGKCNIRYVDGIIMKKLRQQTPVGSN